MAPSTIDRILDVLDVGLQRSPEHGYPEPARPGDLDYRAPEITPEDLGAETRAYHVWVDRIASGRFTKGQCSQFGAAIARRAAGFTPHGKRTALTDRECRTLAGLLRARGGVLLTEEHTEQGLTWLERYGARVLGWTETEHAEIIGRFSHFTYRGDVKVYGESPYYGGTLPIWRVHLHDGRRLDYYNAAWQSGETDGAAWWWIGGDDA